MIVDFFVSIFEAKKAQDFGSSESILRKIFLKQKSHVNETL